MSPGPLWPHNHDMPLVRPCARPGCPEYARAEKRFCEGHAEVEEAIARQAEAKRRARPNRTRAKQIYSDPRWGTCRAAVMDRASGRCESCGAEGVELDGHHILGLTGTDDDFDPELVLAACRTCHPELERRRRSGYARR